MQLHYPLPLPLLLLLLLLPFLTLNAAIPPKPDDAVSLLAFKTKADKTSTLPFLSPTHFCTWKGVQCSQENRVTKLLLQDLPLGGTFPSNSLSLLDQLRVLSLQNLSLSGPIPDLSNLHNLKSLFLDFNSFSGPFPSSITFLYRLRHLHLSHNNLSGPLPPSVLSLDRLISLELNSNSFSGPLPPLNQSYLSALNFSNNNFSGPIPITPTFLRFGPSSFRSNPGLCGEIIHKECHPGSPFFGAPLASGSGSPPPPVSLTQNGQLHGVDELKKPIRNTSDNKGKTTAVVIGFCSGVSVLIISLLCLATAVRRKRRTNQKELVIQPGDVSVESIDPESSVVMQMGMQENELHEKVNRVQKAAAVGKSGSLLFCAGEEQLYTLDQLMRGSAELLGRGSVGTTYKAVLDNRLIVSVKRLDGGKLRGVSREGFERHMEAVGGLRHPNLVPLRAYFQGKDERLLVYDYQPNGSLFSLVHGSKSNRAKPLHWTSCLKIAEDIAQGLSYIHQAWRLVHGNLKSSNVLLGPDFEACISDYCLSALSHNGDPSENHEDPDTTAYKAPELIFTKTSLQQPTSKSDVYAFGILLLELLTGKPPSQLPDLPPGEMAKWVRFVREEGDGVGDDNKLEMLLEVAMACSLAAPDQRPTMWQVLKMLQEIKEVVLMDDSSDPLDPQNFSISL